MATKKESTTSKSVKAGTKSATSKTSKSASEKPATKPAVREDEPGTAKSAVSKTSDVATKVPTRETNQNGNGQQDVKLATITSFVSYDQIAQRAYLLWLERGCAHGSDVEDWLRAEAELKN